MFLPCWFMLRVRDLMNLDWPVCTLSPRYYAHVSLIGLCVPLSLRYYSLCNIVSHVLFG